MSNSKNTTKGNKNKDEIQELNIKASEEDLRGNYANVAAIRHTENEFVLDFVLRLDENAQLVSRILTNPKHMKKLSSAMKENVDRYEEKFGKIDP